MMFQQRLAKLVCVLLLLASAAQASSQTQAETNSALIKQAFEDWKQGSGGLFDLLAEEAQWTVAGVSPVSAHYNSRQAFLEDAVQPIHAQLSTPITPEVRHIIAQDNHVMVLWDGHATALDGSHYQNSYAWHLLLEGGRITQATAFLDTWALVELIH